MKILKDLFMKILKSQIENAITVVSKAIGREEQNMTISSDGQTIYFEKTDNKTFAKAILSEKCPPFNMVVDSFKMLSLIKSTLSEEIEIDIKEKHLVLKIDKSKLRINAIEKEYPLFSYPQDENLEKILTIKGGEIKSAIKMALNYVAGPTEVRYYLIGCLFTKSEKGFLKIVATNGHFLTEIETSVVIDNWQSDIIIPTAVLKALLSILKEDDEVQILLDKITKGLFFKTNALEVKTPVVDGKYPDYKRAIPDCDQELLVSKSDLLLSFSRMDLLTDDKKIATVIKFENDKVELEKLLNGLVSTDTFQGEGEMKKVRMAINAALVLDAIKDIKQEKFFMATKFKESPLVLKGDNFISVIMGMRE